MTRKLILSLLAALALVFCGSQAQAATILCTPVSGLGFSPSIDVQAFGRDAAIGTISPPVSTLIAVTCTSDPTSAHSFALQVGSYDGVAVPGK